MGILSWLVTPRTPTCRKSETGRLHTGHDERLRQESHLCMTGPWASHVASNSSPARVTTGGSSWFRRLEIASDSISDFRTTMSKSESISFVFANAKGAPGRIINQLKRISNIASITPVTGRFDLVIK